MALIFEQAHIEAAVDILAQCFQIEEVGVLDGIGFSGSSQCI